MNKSSQLRIAISGLAAAVLTLPCVLAWSENVESNSAPGNVLLLDSLGRLVSVPSNQVPASLQPPSAPGPNRQIPQPTEGAIMPEVILQRMREGNIGVEYFPAVPPALMPYLASQDEYGNTIMRPGPLFQIAPFEPYLQDAKYWLSDRGLRYSLEQNFTYVSMTDIKKGYNNLDFYSLNLKSKWEIYSVSGDDGTAGWISTQIEAKAELGPNVGEQTPKSNLGTITDPSGIWSSVNGFRVPEVAWQQSLADGKVVALAGLVSQGNYMDRNAYAQSSGNGPFNSALVHSMVLPLPSYNFGLNLQWQPLPEWYGMMGGSVGDAAAGTAPRTGFNSAYWSVLWEFGYAPHDVLGLGPGIYRIQPFVAQVGQYTGEGLGFDLQQKLGPDSPFGWFGRFGFGGYEVSSGAAAQVATGIAIQGPFKHVLLQRTSNDVLDLGFVWSQPSESSSRLIHENEYVLETKYAMQLTPTIKLQPDFQMVWNPAYNSKADQAAVFQLQLYMAW